MVLEKFKKSVNSISIQVKATVWFLVCSFLQKGISTITTPIFTRLMTTAEYGQYSVFNSWFGIVSVIVSLSLYQGVFTQGLIKFQRERTVYASSLQGLTFSLCLVWGVIYWGWRSFWNQLFGLTTIQMLAMMIMTWTSSVFGLWATEKRVEYKYKSLVAVTLISCVAKPALGILFVFYATDKVTARILGLVLVEVIMFSGMFFAQLVRAKTFFSAKYWRYALLMNIPLIPHYLSSVILNSADRIMIREMVGESEAGIYSLAYSVSMLTTLFNTALTQTMAPWYYEKIRDKKIQDLSNITYALLIGIASINIIMIALAPEIIAIFAPVEYYDAIWVIPPIVMSVYFTFAYSVFSYIEFYYEKTKFIALATMVAAVFNIILNTVFIKTYGYYAAGYTTLICYVVSTTLHYCNMRKICNKELAGKTPYKFKILMLITGGFLSVGFAFLLVYNNLLLRISLSMLLIAIAIINRRKIVSLLSVLKTDKT